MAFSDTDICKSRSNCYQCRNNDRFRSQMEKRYGNIECPEGFQIGISIEELPEKSRISYNRIKEMEVKIENKKKEVSTLLNELQMIIPKEGKDLVDKIRNLVLPNTKTPARCIYGGGKIGEIDEKCCGGKIVKKPTFNCDKHQITTEKKCVVCGDFKS